VKARFAPVLVLVLFLGGCGSSASFKAHVHTTRVGATSIAWYERGRGSPLVLLTGTGSTMSEWDPALLRLLARRHRLILFDYPGIGLSGPWRGRSFDSLGATTLGLIRAIGLRRAAVLGWSMGGFVAQRLAVDHPEAVSNLVLAATNPGGPEAVLGPPAVQRVDSEPNPPDRVILRELYPAGRRAEGRAFLHRLVASSRSGEIPNDFRDPESTIRVQVAAEDPWLRSGRNYVQLARVRAPTLAVAGDSDRVVPAVNLRRIAARIPRARFLLLPGAHAFLFQSRAAFADAVDAFLSRRRAR
jgi:pimeloyl-ACP methyl ester carboxylesterase